MSGAMLSTELAHDRSTREIQRSRVALRLVLNQARSQTVCDLTGISINRLDTLRRRSNISQRSRHRGPSPSSFDIFFRSVRLRSESASLAALCYLTGLTKLPLHQNRLRCDLVLADQLCDVFELFCLCLPKSSLEFEHLVLLTKGLARNDGIELCICSDCGMAILQDRLTVHTLTCAFCRRLSKPNFMGRSSLAADESNDTTDQQC